MPRNQWLLGGALCSGEEEDERGGGRERGWKREGEEERGGGRERGRKREGEEERGGGRARGWKREGEEERGEGGREGREMGGVRGYEVEFEFHSTAYSSFYTL